MEDHFYGKVSERLLIHFFKALHKNYWEETQEISEQQLSLGE